MENIKAMQKVAYSILLQEFDAVKYRFDSSGFVLDEIIETEKEIKFVLFYHCMNDVGCYDGWDNFTIRYPKHDSYLLLIPTISGTKYSIRKYYDINCDYYFDFCTSMLDMIMSGIHYDGTNWVL